MKDLNVKYLAGQAIERVTPLPIFDETVCEFLDDFSKELKKDARSRQYADIQSLAFFCRRANIQQLKQRYIKVAQADPEIRIGRGLAFHVAPSNVPVNFAFSYIFGLVSGNANIVKVTSRDYEQVDIICDAVNRLFHDKSDKYALIAEQTALIRYDRTEDEVTRRLSELSDVRVIWGGNETISQIRMHPIPTRSKEITFADRYSIAILDAATITDADEKELERLAGQFYNDTYLMDQNACSTPHMIFWKGDNVAICQTAQQKFWQAVYDVASKYDLADIKVSDKYVMLCEYAMELSDIQIQKWDNLLYVITMKALPEDITELRGKFGLFFQYEIKNLEEVADYMNKTVQSCMVYGVESSDVANLIITHHLAGIDRIVPVGNSLDIGLIWDGYNLPREMSRIVTRC